MLNARDDHVAWNRVISLNFEDLYDMYKDQLGLTGSPVYWGETSREVCKVSIHANELPKIPITV